jgi:hypothetical protein
VGSRAEAEAAVVRARAHARPLLGERDARFDRDVALRKVIADVGAGLVHALLEVADAIRERNADDA